MSDPIKLTTHKNPDYIELLSLMNSNFVQGNQISRLKNGKETFDSLIEELENSKESIDFQTYVYSKGSISKKIAEILIRKSKQGVKVRLLVDYIGALEIPSEIKEKIKKSNVDSRAFRSPFSRHFINMSHRSHRRIVVCDRKVVFTGGIGIAQEWEGDARNSDEWRDTHFKIQGPLVNNLYGIFLENWCESSKGFINLKEENFIEQKLAGDSEAFCLRSKPNFGSSHYLLMLQTLIQKAKNEIIINTPYFLPGSRICELLCDAQKRGVQIKLLIPGKYIDHKVSTIASNIYLGEILKCGVEVWKYQKTMIHSKVLLVDHQISCVGSANFNQRSLKKDEEIILFAKDQNLYEQLKTDFYEDLDDSKKMFYDDWKNRSIISKFLEKIIYPFKNYL